jgi:transcriptional regulator with XRE-family HTH domain
MPRRPGPVTLARKLGARIRTLRKEVGITQERLAWDCDLDKGYLSQVESGKRLPSVPVLFQLAHRLGVQAADIVALDQRDVRVKLLDASRGVDAQAVQAVLVRLAKPRA